MNTHNYIYSHGKKPHIYCMNTKRCILVHLHILVLLILTINKYFNSIQWKIHIYISYIFKLENKYINSTVDQNQC